MPSGEARGVAEAACCVLREEVGSICSLLSSSSEDRKDPPVAMSSSTSGLTSPARPKIMGGSSSLHTTRHMPSNLHYPMCNSHMAATHRLLLLLIPGPAGTPPGGGSNNSNNPLGLVISRRDHRRRSCGNSSRNKPCTKAYMIERRSSRRKVFLPRQVVTYTGTHRLLHSQTTLKGYQTKEGDSRRPHLMVKSVLLALVARCRYDVKHRLT